MKIPSHIGRLAPSWISTSAVLAPTDYYHSGNSFHRQPAQRFPLLPLSISTKTDITTTAADTTATLFDDETMPSNKMPYFASPKKKTGQDSPPPDIPPPYDFDDPVDLAVIVSWVRFLLLLLSEVVVVQNVSHLIFSFVQIPQIKTPISLR